MQLQFTKHTGGKHILKYIRDNGTQTWMQSNDYFIHHDLSHYALEKILGYTTAFNGMINSGMDIRDFEDRDKRKQMQVTAEAWYAENMANLFLIETVQGNFEDFNAVQQAAFVSFNRDHELITLAQSIIEEVRTYLRSLLEAWRLLPEGETLALTFNV